MIDIIALNEDDLDKTGIYRIWFGHKYYIGSTVNSYSRLLMHNKAICEGFLGIKRGQNSITNIVDHLNRHTYIATGYFELIFECKSERELVFKEQEFLDVALYDKNCLNYQYTVYRRVDGRTFSVAIAFQEECKLHKEIFGYWVDKPNNPYTQEQWSQVLTLASYA